MGAWGGGVGASGDMGWGCGVGVWGHVETWDGCGGLLITIDQLLSHLKTTRRFCITDMVDIES